MQVRNKTTGARGECVLYYDRVTGRYVDPQYLHEEFPRRDGSAGAGSGGTHGGNGAGSGLVLTADGTLLQPVADASMEEDGADEAGAAAGAAFPWEWPAGAGAADDQQQLQDNFERAASAEAGFVG